MIDSSDDRGVNNSFPDEQNGMQRAEDDATGTAFDTAGPVEIAFRSVSAEDNISYLLVDRASGEALLIDAADRPGDIRAMLRAADGRARQRGEPAPRVIRILTTHSHWDHHRALTELARESGAQTLAGREDAKDLSLPPDRVLDHGDTVDIGATTLTVISLRGHTPGSVALALTSQGQAPRLFTGDSLFPGGVGNTHGDPVRFASLLRDVEERIFAVYSDASIVYPGHGAPTTLGTERPQLPAWRARGW